LLTAQKQNLVISQICTCATAPRNNFPRQKLLKTRFVVLFRKHSDQSLGRIHYGLTMEVSTVNFPGFVFSKLSWLQLAIRGFVLSNGIKNCYIASMRKMLNNFVWALSKVSAGCPVLSYLFTICQLECDLALYV
jgi:hypothetical protein